ITVDTTVTAATIDDNALSVFLPALPLETGKTFNLSVFSSGDGVTKTVSVKVGAIENVAVPAGTFPAYRLELSGMQLPIVMHVTQQAPRRVVRVAPTGAPLIFELVKYENHACDICRSRWPWVGSSSSQAARLGVLGRRQPVVRLRFRRQRPPPPPQLGIPPAREVSGRSTPRRIAAIPIRSS